jgi:hypothetical protein
MQGLSGASRTRSRPQVAAGRGQGLSQALDKRQAALQKPRRPMPAQAQGTPKRPAKKISPAIQKRIDAMKLKQAQGGLSGAATRRGRPAAR